MDFEEEVKSIKVKRGEVLHGAGDICKKAFRVESGCLKSYVLDSSGKEHIIQFAPENWLISDMASFFNQEPSKIFIEAIEDSHIQVFSHDAYADLEKLNDRFILEMNHKLRNSLIASNKRLIALLSATAEQRYIEFTQTYPMLVQRLPLKLIASYIGITPEYLSEIRRKLAGK
jgi:CRP-like cAMP-binding protein